MSSRTRTSSDLEKPIIRRSQGACAECRRRRSRCDSARRPGIKCTNCELANIDCNSVVPQRPQIQKQQDYIRILEARIKRLEGYIRALYPDEEVDYIISKPPPYSEGRGPRPVLSDPVHSSASFIPSKEESSAERPEDFPEISEADDISHVILAKQLERISLTPTAANRFFGQASPIMAVQQASTLRSQLTGVPDTGLDPKEYRRTFFWTVSPWEYDYVSSSETIYVYPEFDLLLNLVTIYFEKINCLIPILHEPTFMEDLMSWKHCRDQSFGMTVLLVCANASRYSADHRVFSSPDHTQRAMSAGWHYFSQVPIHRKLMLYTATVYDLQYYSLAAMYLSGTSLCPVSCNFLGIGLRYAMELGAHRRTGMTRFSGEAELLKRAFWGLYCLDTVNNSFYGRPSGISHESFDIEYPIECDDEYWENDDPEKAFKQPTGKPCTVSSFVHLIKLCKILGFASRTLYSTKKSRILAGYFGTDWEMRMVAELDSSLNRWKESLPPYLLWDPNREDLVFFHQAANLHATFSYIQIQVHRPFLTKQSSLSFSSLAMCTNAARSCAHIQEAALARDLRVLPQTTFNAFTAGIITVLCLWGSHRPGYVGDHQKEKDNLLKCVKILGECEAIWHSAGALRDILCEAGAVSQVDENREPQSFPMENYGQSQSPGHDILEQSIFSPPTTVEETTLTNTDWDLYRLLLTEMGHREVGPTNVATIDIQVTASEATQPPDSANVNDAFTFWSDASTAYSRFEEWDTFVRDIRQMEWYGISSMTSSSTL